MMVQPIAINVCNISKSYRRYAHPVDRFKELIFPNAAKGEEFWALRDVSLQVKKGESVGILGQNGSGKSTLLQIITQTLTPTQGMLEVNGRISALLELGSGFNPDFTGRQNVMVNGRILGFSRKDIDSKLEEIIDFAEIGDFVDQPVHTYSSGMFVRLAFAAAVVWEPEILIVDEALAVGDIFFQQKCFLRIKSLQEKGMTLLFVSHDNQTILNLCSQAAVMNHGQLVYFGDASTAVERYHELYYMSHPQDIPTADLKYALSTSSNSFHPNRKTSSKESLPFVEDFSPKNRYGNSIGLLQGVCITNSVGKSSSPFLIDDELTISIKIGFFPSEIAPLNVGFHLRDRLGQLIVGTNTKLLDQDLLLFNTGEPFICQFKFRPRIAPGDYTLDIAVAENVVGTKIIYDWINSALAFSLTAGLKVNEQSGICRPDISVEAHTLESPIHS